MGMADQDCFSVKFEGTNQLWINTNTKLSNCLKGNKEFIKRLTYQDI